jgi:arylsulfatase A-like enzyme/Tfp pilus assembly protein PilF
LLVTIDTLRADRLGVGVTPVIDAVAARGLRFTNARTVAPLTLPAHTSMLTGQLPPLHGVRLNGVTSGTGTVGIAERLRRAGYKTAAVVGAFVLDRRFGLAEGFDVYDDHIPRDASAAERLDAERPANVVVDRAISIVQDLEPSRPWFLWVHFYDPHAPYAPPRPATGTGSAYDAEVSFADTELGRLLTAIDRRGDGLNTAVVIAGDHGEGLGEHGETTHGMLLFDSTLRVPLVVAAPQVAPAVRSDLVSLIDVAPTLLALAGQSPDAALAGRNLFDGPDAERELYAETDYPAAAGWHPARALIHDRFKLISSAGSRLFDLSTDGAEKHDTASARPQTVNAMRARLETLGQLPSESRAPASAIDSETAARLRALGYVAASPASSSGPLAAKPDAAAHTEAWTAFERALSARSAGDVPGALALLTELARKHPDATVFVSTRAQVLAEAGRLDEALRAFRDILRRWPDQATLYHELAVVARATGQQAEAMRAERAALAIDPALPTAHNGLGLVLADAGDHRAAASAFAEAARRDPSNGSYLSNLGNARRALGDLAGARQAYQMAVERDGSLADAANGLGVILVQEKRAAEAIPWFERAVANDAGFVEAQLNLGIALQESGRRDRALAQYRHVERSAPEGSRERVAARELRRQLEGR